MLVLLKYTQMLITWWQKKTKQKTNHFGPHFTHLNAFCAILLTHKLYTFSVTSETTTYFMFSCFPCEAFHWDVLPI